MADQGNITFTVELKGNQLEFTEKFKKSVKEVGEEAEKAEGKMSNFGSSFAGAFAAITTDRIIQAASAMKDFVLSYAELADSIGETATKTGMSAESVQKLAYAFKLSGEAFGTIEEAIDGTSKAFKFLTKNQEEAATGNKTAIESFAKLGISLDEVRNSSPEELFAKVADGISLMGTEGERTVASIGVLGKTGADLVPSLMQGSRALTALGEEASATGKILSGETVKAAQAFNDELDKLKIGLGAGILSSGLFADLTTFVDRLNTVNNAFSNILGGSTSLYEVLKEITLWTMPAGMGFMLKEVGLLIDKYNSMTKTAPRSSSDNTADFNYNVELVRKRSLIENARNEAMWSTDGSKKSGGGKPKSIWDNPVIKGQSERLDAAQKEDDKEQEKIAKEKEDQLSKEADWERKRWARLLDEFDLQVKAGLEEADRIKMEKKAQQEYMENLGEIIGLADAFSQTMSTVGEGIAATLVEGEFDWEAAFQGVLQNMIAMTVQLGIMIALVSALNAIPGGTAILSLLNLTAQAAAITNVTGQVPYGGTKHTGGYIDGSMPSYHSGGLAPNERIAKVLLNEYVMQPKATAALGKNNLDYMNNTGKIPGGGNYSVTVNAPGSTGKDADKIARTVGRAIKKQQRQGYKIL